MDGSSHAKAKPTTFFFALHRNARVCSFFFSPFDCLAVDSSILQACLFDLSLLFIYLFARSALFLSHLRSSCKPKPADHDS
jgi:hypothetical protein